MAELVGLYNPLGIFPGFLVPVFRQRVGANVLLVQTISSAGTIDDFETTSVGLEDVFPSPLAATAEIGGEGIWSFALTEREFCVGPRHTLARWLASRLDELAVKGNPFTYLEAVEFVGALGRRAEALRSVFGALSETSPAQAEAWRDLDILLPDVRMGMRDAVSTSRQGDGLERSIRQLILQVRSRTPVVTGDT